MKSISGVALGIFLSLSPCLIPVSVAENPISIPIDYPMIGIPSDARAKYTFLSVSIRPDGLVEVVNKREGSSGTTYSKRLVDCANSQFMYLGSGDTEAKMDSGAQADSKMSALTEGSVSFYVSDYACRNAPRSQR